MRVTMTLAIVLLFGAVCFAQTPTAAAGAGQKSAPTAEQLIEKAIAAYGGREAAQKMTSVVMTGTMDISAFGMQGDTQTYRKAPNKVVTLTNIGGFGEVGNGFDGSGGWHLDPQSGLTDVTGQSLAVAKIDSEFQGDLKFKQLYSKAEVTGQEKIGGRDCWVMKLTSVEGINYTRYYDAETFLLLKGTVPVDPAQGSGDIEAMPSDYRDIGNGLKLPYKVTLNVPGVGELVITYKEIKYNVPIDDAKFAKPKS
ncbi:MAG TPA: hypothetical protein VI756_29550 [Blastocatellia bacterium]